MQTTMATEEEIIDVVEEDKTSEKSTEEKEDHLVPSSSPFQAYNARLQSESDYAR